MERDLLTSVTAPIQSELDGFNNYFNSLFDTDDDSVRPLLEVLGNQRGKMLRPILVLLTAKYFGVSSDRIFHLASSVELLHTSTLIHDDVVDNSMLRRGNPSFNSLFDNKMSVLFGDYVLAMALRELSSVGVVENFSILSELSKNLSSGEIFQLVVRNSDVLSEDSYFDIIYRKTACLFSSCCRMTAITCGADPKQADAFAEFGRLAGICFQIKDDIFDYFSSSDTGKPSGNDLQEGKFTLPAIFALNTSDRDWSSYIKSVRSCSADESMRREITEYTVENGGVRYAEERMREISASAMRSLPSDMSSDLRIAFRDYVSLILNRTR